MIKIRIRHIDYPQDSKKFLNKTTIIAIILHELAHLKHMDHNLGFALFLKDIFEFAAA